MCWVTYPLNFHPTCHNQLEGFWHSLVQEKFPIQQNGPSPKLKICIVCTLEATTVHHELLHSMVCFSPKTQFLDSLDLRSPPIPTNRKFLQQMNIHYFFFLNPFDLSDVSTNHMCLWKIFLADLFDEILPNFYNQILPRSTRLHQLQICNSIQKIT